jgi:hypothetical protein
MIRSRSARAEAWVIALCTSSHSLTRELVSNQNEFEDESEMAHKKGQGSSPGKNVGLGRDWTIFSLIDGQVTFDQEGRRINVLPVAVAAGKS